MDRCRRRRYALPGRFPRTRGDGPTRIIGRWRWRRFPPHARGWTESSRSRSRSPDVSPARAGMDLAPTQRDSGFAGFPRTRGDGPGAGPAIRRECRFPPHARGWTRHGDRWDQGSEVSPARAGMDRRWSAPAARQYGFPRTRGDGPLISRCAIGRYAFPPHARGWTRQPPPLDSRVRVRRSGQARTLARPAAGRSGSAGRGRVRSPGCPGRGGRGHLPPPRRC